ncbi:hypothetical protein EWH99_05765 [Sporolactobacillus sp. THM7-7]|nr:hypothetical protein EWH99_05765 [Sporolactobacillus sp. THM7-7]
MNKPGRWKHLIMITAVFFILWQNAGNGTVQAKSRTIPRLSPSQVKVVNHNFRNDTVTVSKVRRGDVIRIYQVKGRLLKKQTARRSQITLLVRQLGTTSGRIFLTVMHPHKRPSGRTWVSYDEEPSALLKKNQVKVTNNYGKKDTITVCKLKKNDVIRAYNKEGKLLKRQVSKGTQMTVSISQLGRTSGRVNLTVQHPNRRPSRKTPIDYGNETTPAVKASQVRVANNTGAPDRITVYRLKKGDVIRAYNKEGKLLKAQTAKGAQVDLFIDQLGTVSRKIYLTETHPSKRTSGKTAIFFSGETTPDLDPGQVRVTNNHGIPDTVTVSGIGAGDVIHIFGSDGQPLAKGTSEGTTLTLSVDQLGEGAGQINASVTCPNMEESGKTAVSYPGESVPNPISVLTQNTVYGYSLSDAVNIQMNTTSMSDKKYAMFVPQDALDMSGSEGKVRANPDPTVDNQWDVRGGPSPDSWIVTRVSRGKVVKVVNTVQTADQTWSQIDFKTNWVHAAPSDLQYYLDPNHFLSGTDGYYQFLKLSGTAGADENEINNKILNNKGILTGKAAVFIEAAKQQNINELYLISQALLETGNGMSALANGIVVDQVDGQPVPPRTVYNMFGIGATDDDPYKYGSIKAYKEGWFTPEAAIIGGASYIGGRYIHSSYRQDTLYKMRWNPDRPSSHQYATDIGWAAKQTLLIKKLYDQLSSYSQTFDVPKYNP